MTIATLDREATLEALEATLELVEESLADAQLAAEDRGWSAGFDLNGVTPIRREEIEKRARQARVMAFADPLIRRGLALRTGYVWGGGVTIAADQDEDAAQDVNAVVQAFLDDPSNKASLTSGQAREELERRLGTDGNDFTALITNPVTGRVQVRNIPWSQILDVIADPEDAATPWFYLRQWTTTAVEAGYVGTRTRRETRRAYYPALGFRPTLRPVEIGGVPIEWDKPLLHTTVNRPDGSVWGIGDVFAALPWALGYKQFLEDWARYMRSLSSIAWKVTAKSKPGAAAIRERIASAPASIDGGIGQVAVTSDSQNLSAISKSGATLDSESGRPLAAMCAAAMDVPVTMLLSDPGVTGARATAETLDRPTEDAANARRATHTSRLAAILEHVVTSQVRAPQGALTGTITLDRETGRETVALANNQSSSVTIDWPDLTDVDVKVLVDAIAAADGTEVLPPQVVLRLLLVALRVENADEVIKSCTDEQGNFVYPADAAAAASQQNAIANGDQPNPVG